MFIFGKFPGLKVKGETEWELRMADYECDFQNGKEEKENTKTFYWKTETKSSPSVETCRTGKWGDICLAHAWQVNKTARGFSRYAHLWHPLPPQASEGEVSIHVLCRSPSWLLYWEVILSWEQNAFPFESSQDWETHVERTFCPWQTGNQTPSPWTWTLFPHLEASLILWFWRT